MWGRNTSRAANDPSVSQSRRRHVLLELSPGWKRPLTSAFTFKTLLRHYALEGAITVIVETDGSFAALLEILLCRNFLQSINQAVAGLHGLAKYSAINIWSGELDMKLHNYSMKSVQHFRKQSRGEWIIRFHSVDGWIFNISQNCSFQLLFSE